jgi:dGTP triphosphohydrolase
MSKIEYFKSVEIQEAHLLQCAKRSFEPFSNEFIDGGDVFKYFTARWEKSSSRLRNRTPLQLERDRILYSPGMRKQTEKYHVLYNGQRRIVRAYATHAMKMAQVSRAIARGLGLNQDFAEAISLGAKIGAVPFIHAAKSKMSEWAEMRLKRIDADLALKNPLSSTVQDQLAIDFGDTSIPEFVSRLQSSTVLEKVQCYMPWAAGQQKLSLYSSGQESYWLLCSNPFTTEVRKEAYFPETMYGIWRHTLGLNPGGGKFTHKVKLSGAIRGFNLITDSHATFEAIIVQYADDITWAIENLNDANEVALLNGAERSIYEKLGVELADIDPAFDLVIRTPDAGLLYTYFIDNFIRHSEEVLGTGEGSIEMREALIKGDKSVLIGLSPEANRVLEKLISFLHTRVFTEPRTKNRFELLKDISEACIDLIYASPDILPQAIKDQSKLHRWKDDVEEMAIKLLEDPVHRIQLSLDILASWGDQQIYDFVGIQSL